MMVVLCRSDKSSFSQNFNLFKARLEENSVQRSASHRPVNVLLEKSSIRLKLKKDLIVFPTPVLLDPIGQCQQLSTGLTIRLHQATHQSLIQTPWSNQLSHLV